MPSCGSKTKVLPGGIPEEVGIALTVVTCVELDGCAAVIIWGTGEAAAGGMDCFKTTVFAGRGALLCTVLSSDI